MEDVVSDIILIKNRTAEFSKNLRLITNTTVLDDKSSFCLKKRTGIASVQWKPIRAFPVSWEIEQRRKPILLLLLSGVLLLRFVVRQFSELLFQLPPRFTRLEPYDAIPFNRKITFFLNILHSA